jgi:hypothetical protein
VKANLPLAQKPVEERPVGEIGPPSAPSDDLSWVAEERRRREAQMAATAARKARKAAERVPSRALVVAQEVLPPVSSRDHTIAVMNEHHAIIDNVGGKTVIACWAII